MIAGRQVLRIQASPTAFTEHCPQWHTHPQQHSTSTLLTSQHGHWQELKERREEEQREEHQEDGDDPCHAGAGPTLVADSRAGEAAARGEGLEEGADDIGQAEAWGGEGEVVGRGAQGEGGGEEERGGERRGINRNMGINGKSTRAMNKK